MQKVEGSSPLSAFDGVVDHVEQASLKVLSHVGGPGPLHARGLPVHGAQGSLPSKRHRPRRLQRYDGDAPIVGALRDTRGAAR